MKKHILLALMTMGLPMTAQNITFDTDDLMHGKIPPSVQISSMAMLQ